MNKIYILPTDDSNLSLTRLESIFNLQEWTRNLIVDTKFYPRQSTDYQGDSVLELPDAIDIGEECEFRFYKSDWDSGFLGKVLSYGYTILPESELKELIIKYTRVGYLVQVTGGPDSFENRDEMIIYFGFIISTALLFQGYIFLDPEGNVNNSKYYNELEKGIYSVDSFKNYVLENYFNSTKN